MSALLYKKNFFRWRLGRSEEQSFRYRALEDIKPLVAGICIAVSVAVWLLRTLYWDVGENSLMLKLLPPALIQMLLLAIYGTTFLRGRASLWGSFITPLYGVTFLYIYLEIYGSSIPPERQLLMNGVVSVLIICFSALDRILPPVSALGGVLYAFTFLWFAHRGGVYSEGQFAQLIAQCLLANIIGAFIGYVMARQARYEFLLQQDLAAEKEISERLLKRILPESVAAKISGPDMRLAESHAEVTVLFADLVGFTALTEQLRADQVVSMLDELFSGFDQLCTKIGVEKIKTIGDAYMAVAGCPQFDPDHAQRVASAALEMRRLMERFQQRTGYNISIRIGIHSGPVVAGVICDSRFCYDVWGSTVNTAARLESAAPRGRILVSQAARDLMTNQFIFGPKTAIEAKGIGLVPCFELTGLKTGLLAA